MIRINLIGELGNHLYQYSACRSIAKKLGYDFYVDCYGMGLNYHFGGDRQIKSIAEIFNFDIGREVGDIKYNYYESLNGRTIITGPEMININSYGDSFNLDGIKDTINSVLNKISDFTLLNGFFPNSFYFENYIDELISWFSFKEEDYSLLEKFNPDDYCFIHFRGGDFYEHFKDKEQFLTEIYYRNAISNINVKKFVIITNDVQLAEKHFEWMKDNYEYHIVKNSINTDFFTLTRAKYYVGSYSSFSEWAGYLNINRGKNQMIFPHNIRGKFDEQFYPFKYFYYHNKIN